MADRDLTFCTAIRVESFSLPTPKPISIGPYGENGTIVSLCRAGNDTETQVEFRHRVSNPVADFFAEVRDSLISYERPAITTERSVKSNEEEFAARSPISREKLYELIDARPQSVKELTARLSRAIAS